MRDIVPWTTPTLPPDLGSVTRVSQLLANRETNNVLASGLWLLSPNEETQVSKRNKD